MHVYIHSAANAMNSSDIESARQLYQLSKVGSSNSSSSSNCSSILSTGNSHTSVNTSENGVSPVTSKSITAVTKGYSTAAAASTTQQDAAMLLVRLLYLEEVIFDSML
jgi:hypothetical protein